MTAIDGLPEEAVQAKLAQIAADLAPLVSSQASKREITVCPALDWFALENADFQESWLVEPFLPKGSYVAIVASRGQGKSMFLQETAANLSAGRPFLRQSFDEGIKVLYLDFENPESELQNRFFLTFGYHAPDLQNLYYLHFPQCPAFDREEAEAWWQVHLDAYDPCLVVIDTLSRVVSGSENDADTYIRFFNYSAVALKRRGVTLVTLDHLGKDVERGSRGSSAKEDGPDFVLQMSVKSRSENDATVTLKSTKHRNTSVPDSITIQRKNGRHSMEAETFDEPEIKLARELDRLALPVEISVREAKSRLKEAGRGAQMAVLTKAVRLRKLPDYMPRLPGNGS